MAKPNFNLKDKKIILVGATGILGRGYARAFSEMGAVTVLIDRPGSDVLKLADELLTHGMEMDISDEAMVKDVIAEAIDILGGLDGVINNAAATGEGLLESGDAFAPFESYPLNLWQKVIDINLTGTFLVARETGEALKNNGGGSLINVSSIYGIVGPDHRLYENQPFKSFASYSASKAGVIGFTRWLATWWAKDNVRVNCITPGGVYNNHNAEFLADYANKTPMGRMANREELVGMTVFLLSDASSYCTGQNYIVDGGFTAW